jgi:hypothetical protein
LISLCACLAVSCRTVRDAPAAAIRMFDTVRTSGYQVRIRTEQAEVTGILIVKYMDGEWRGSLMNEFGLKAFDIVASEKKCRLQHVVPFLDKWYIRRTLERDFIYLFRDAPKGKTVKNKRLMQTGEGAFVLKNEARRIEYSFRTFAL